MKICARMGCTREGEWYPVLRLWAPNKRGAPIKMVFNMAVCDFHKHAKVEELIGDQVWQQITAAVRCAGKVAPDRRLTQLDWITAMDPDYVTCEQIMGVGNTALME